MGTRRRRTERAALLATAVLSLVAPLLASSDLHPPGQILLAVLFVLLVPGAPVAVLLRLPDPLASAVIGMAVSLASLLTLSTGLVVAGAWSAAGVSWVLAGVAQALVVAAWSLTRTTRSGQGHPGAPTPVDLPALTPHRVDVLPHPSASVDVLPDTPLPAELPTEPDEPDEPNAELYTGLPRRISDAAPRLLPLVALVGAVELWAWAVSSLDLDRIGASGAIGIIGTAYVASLCLIATVIGWALRRHDPDPLVMTAACAALVLVVFGLLNAADSAGGFRTAWVHVGFIDYITHHGALAKGYDARFSWPGFFAAGAAVVHLAGLSNAAPLIRWAPVTYNLLALPALLVIGRAVTGSRRTAWLGVVLYYCFNWFSQDYLSPQATVLLLYVAVIATLLATGDAGLPSHGPPLRRLLVLMRTAPLRPTWLGPGRALAIEGLLALLCVAAVVSHQLTPVALIGVLLAFALVGGTRYRLLWLLTGLAFLGWFSFGAEDFWRGHLGYVFGDVGKLGATLGSSVGERLHGNAVHGRMQQIRLLCAAGSLGLAAIGLWLRRSSGRAVLFGALAFGPFGLLAVQSYGGEVALRCFVYAGPALAPLAAVAVMSARDRLPTALRLEAVALPVVVLVASLAVTANRGANIGFERVTSTQLVVADKLQRAMPTKSRIGLLADAGPLGFERLTEFEAISLAPDVCGRDIVRCVRRNRPDYLYVTSTMDVLGQLEFGEPPHWTAAVVGELVSLHLYRRLASERDASVYGRVAATP